MLKIEIFDKPEREEPPVLRLNTRVTSNGSFEVFACDHNGDPLGYGKLWALHADGRQSCLSGISDNLGLDLHKNDKIRDA